MNVTININIDDRLVAWIKRIVPRPRTVGFALLAALGITGVVAGAMEGQVAPFLFASGNVISSAAVNSDLAALFTSSWGVSDAGNYFVVAPQANTDTYVGINTNQPADPLHVYSAAGKAYVAMFESTNQANGTFVQFTDHYGGVTSTTAQIGSAQGNLLLTAPATGVFMSGVIPDMPFEVRSDTSALGLNNGTGYFQIGGDDQTGFDNMAFSNTEIQVRHIVDGGNTAANLTLEPFGGKTNIGTTADNSNMTVNGAFNATNGVTANSGNIVATTGEIIATTSNITATAGNMSAGGNITATGVVSGSNLPSGLVLDIFTGDNGSQTCADYCVRDTNAPFCVTGRLSAGKWPDGGQYAGCDARGGTGMYCLCAGF